MKKIAAIGIAISIVSILAGCAKGLSGQKYVGNMLGLEGSLEFVDDTKVIVGVAGEELMEATYTVEKNVLTLNADGETAKGAIDRKAKTVALDMDDDGTNETILSLKK